MSHVKTNTRASWSVAWRLVRSPLGYQDALPDNKMLGLAHAAHTARHEFTVTRWRPLYGVSYDSRTLYSASFPVSLRGLRLRTVEPEHCSYSLIETSINKRINAKGAIKC